MYAVIFEVTPYPERADDYFNLAAELRPELEKIDGFVSIERFQSLADRDHYVSLSFWRDEAAIKEWREHLGHQSAQDAGKTGIFKDFRIRVARVERDYTLADRS
ncbi:MAG: antibiotic biosynthesis monooxygenase [Rhodospirillales bacterium]